MRREIGVQTLAPLAPAKCRTSALCRDARRALRLTQVEMARVLGVHSQTISKWERSVLRPSAFQAQMCARLLAYGQSIHAAGNGHMIRAYLDSGPFMLWQRVLASHAAAPIPQPYLIDSE